MVVSTLSNFDIQGKENVFTSLLVDYAMCNHMTSSLVISHAQYKYFVMFIDDYCHTVTNAMEAKGGYCHSRYIATATISALEGCHCRSLIGFASKILV